MKRPLFVVACLLASTGLLIAQNKSSLTRLLEAELARFPAKAGVYLKHLRTGEEAAVRADEQFNSASVIKIPVMVVAYRMADQKQLDLNERVAIRKSDIRGGSGIFRYHDLGLNPTLRDVITQMIITSDNTATDLMIAKVGGIDRVNQWLAEANLLRTRLVQTVFEVFRHRYDYADPKYKTLTPEQLMALQSGPSPLPPESLDDRIKRERAQEFWLGAMTPRETGRMLESIEQGTAASKEACDEMKRILRAQQSGARRIPHFITVPSGHKTGDLPPVVANDVGIVYARSGPVVVAFFTMENRGPYAELEDGIGRATRIVVDYFDGAGM